MATHDEQTGAGAADTHDAAARLTEMIADIRVAMVTTYHDDGTLHSRPMYAQQAEGDGDVWFATSRTSSLVNELRDGARVLATFAHPGNHRYVVLHGAGFVRHDPAMIERLWNPAMKAWFPAGPTDPDLTLVRLEAERAEYWDTPSAPMRLLQFVTALATGARPTGGEHVTVPLQHAADTRR